MVKVKAVQALPGSVGEILALLSTATAQHASIFLDSSHAWDDYLVWLEIQSSSSDPHYLKADHLYRNGGKGNSESDFPSIKVIKTKSDKLHTHTHTHTKPPIHLALKCASYLDILQLDLIYTLYCSLRSHFPYFRNISTIKYANRV